MNKRIRLLLLAFELLLVLLFLTGCPFADKTYTTAEEQYAIGWILHNVDEKTGTSLDYSEKDFAVYNYSYNFPATQPIYFANALFWVPPINKNSWDISAAQLIRLGVPLDRVYYLKGENPVPENYRTNWSFQNYIYLNYIRSDDDLAQFNLDMAYTEHYLSDGYNSITPVAGDKKHIYFGKAPFTPASFIVDKESIRLNGHLIRGYGNNSYLLRPMETSVMDFFSGRIVTVKLPMPKYQVYLNGELKVEYNLTDFDYTKAYYFISENGNYVVIISIPIDYPVWNNTIITAAFSTLLSESQPPEFQHIEANPYFIQGEGYEITVDLHDESGIGKAEIYAQENDNWVLLNTKVIDAKNYIYGASYTPPPGSEKINLKIAALDTIGNSVNYTILPVALPAQGISFNLEAKEKASKGELINVNGICKISDKKSCNNFLLGLQINNELFETGQTNDRGEFDFNWRVPFEYGNNQANITVKYSGTGVYLPYEESVIIPIEAFNIDVGVFELDTSGIALGEQVNVSSVIRNLGIKDVSDISVEFSADGSLLGEITISELKASESKPVSFEWLPEREGYYTITMAATAKGDQNPSNDLLDKALYVNYIAPDIFAYLKPVNALIVGTETNVEFEIYNWGEEMAENLKAYLYDFYEPEFLYFTFYGQDSEKKPIPIKPRKPIEEEDGKEGSGISDKPKETKNATEAPSEPPQPGESGGGGGGGEKPKQGESVAYNGTTYTFIAYYDINYIALNVSTKEFNETLYFAFNEKVQRLQNGLYVYMPYSSSSSSNFVIGNAALIEKTIGGLEPDGKITESVRWAPNNTGEYSILLFINASKDSNFDNNYFDERVKSLRTGINIGAKILMSYKDKFIVGMPANISASITNLGTEDAKNIRVSLFEQKNMGSEEGKVGRAKINRSQIGSVNIDTLSQIQSQEIKFNWTPSAAGENYLLLLAETKKDINPEDNNDIVYADVLSKGSDITSRLQYIYGDIFAGDNVTVNGFVINRGKINATNVLASLYETRYKSKKFIGSNRIGILEAESTYDIGFNWTPDSSGNVNLELVSEASNDDNKDNDADSISIAVLSKNYDVNPTIISYPKFILANEESYVSVLLENFGSENAPEFNLTLKANDMQVDSMAINGLNAKDIQFVSFNWLPETEGTYKIEAIANLADANLNNNIAKDTIKVFKAKNTSISFVNKSGDFVERTVVLGDSQGLVNGIALFTIPDTPLEFWIANEENEEFILSIYTNSSIGNKLTIASSRIKGSLVQNGLLLYDIFANNASWNYDSFSSVAQKKLETLDIRYTELKAFMCGNYNFSSDSCGKWEEIPMDALIGNGGIILASEAPKSQAFAIGDINYDNDNEPDWDDDDNDNDGIPDSEDSFTCLDGKFKSRNAFNVTVNESKDTLREFKGRNKVGIKDKNKKVVEFDINLSKDRMDCRNVIIEKEPETAKRGYVLINGIRLTNSTKTAFVDKIAAFKRVCVKDEEISSIDEVTQNCDGSNEYLIACDGIKKNGYTCTDLGQQYRVEGLINSAVAEPTNCQETWACTDWSPCSNEKQTRACNDTNSCGTNFNKPLVEQSCGEGDDSDDNNGGRSGGLSRGAVYNFGEIKGWADGKSQVLKIETNDLVTFIFDKKLNSIVLNSIEGTRIKLSLSFKSTLVSLEKGDTKNFDIDRDGNNDIAIAFESTSLNKATLTLTRINPDIANPNKPNTNESNRRESTRLLPLSEPTGGLNYNESSDSAQPPITKKSWVFNGIIIFGIIMILIVIALGIVYLKSYYREKEGEQEGEQPGLEERKATQKSEYREVESYILNEFNKGFSFEQIKEKLVKAGWNDDLIELVIKDIKNRNNK